MAEMKSVKPGDRVKIDCPALPLMKEYSEGGRIDYPKLRAVCGDFGDNCLLRFPDGIPKTLIVNFLENRGAKTTAMFHNMPGYCPVRQLVPAVRTVQLTLWPEA